MGINWERVDQIILTNVDRNNMKFYNIICVDVDTFFNLFLHFGLCCWESQADLDSICAKLCW